MLKVYFFSMISDIKTIVFPLRKSKFPKLLYLALFCGKNSRHFLAMKNLQQWRGWFSANSEIMESQYLYAFACITVLRVCLCVGKLSNPILELFLISFVMFLFKLICQKFLSPSIVFCSPFPPCFLLLLRSWWPLLIALCRSEHSHFNEFNQPLSKTLRAAISWHVEVIKWF